MSVAASPVIANTLPSMPPQFTEGDIVVARGSGYLARIEATRPIQIRYLEGPHAGAIHTVGESAVETIPEPPSESALTLPPLVRAFKTRNGHAYGRGCLKGNRRRYRDCVAYADAPCTACGCPIGDHEARS